MPPEPALNMPPQRKNDNAGGIDKPSVNKSDSGINKQVVNNAGNIGDKKAKFAEDIKKEPIIQVILDVFDGELLQG
jgi:hypothetical protein